MKINPAAAKQALKSFDFSTLFREHLGWDNHAATLEVPVADTEATLTAVAQKRGFVAWLCPAIPERPTRLRIDQQVTKTSREHFIIYADRKAGKQIWQWVRREPGKPLASREHHFDVSQSGDGLIQRLEQIAIGLAEEEAITVVDVAGRARAAFDVDKVTKRFYDRFKAEHAAFLKLVTGITAAGRKEWYTSLMLNRLMFVYFIQKKGFLDGDTDYLRNRLRAIQKVRGKNKFQSFYRYFLVRLFHDGLGKPPTDRKLDSALEKMLGRVPYLNGGFFEVHQLEETNPDIDIPDSAFEKLFDFFDQYSWHLDERPLRADNEINPDVVGYIFEKYVNQKQMGAYYTKEDITEYISANTLLPYLFDTAQSMCAIAFAADSFLWRLLRDDPDRYIHSAMRGGVVDTHGNLVDLPEFVSVGLGSVEQRAEWNKQATLDGCLPNETWREYLSRRQRYIWLRDHLAAGKVASVDAMISLNLDLWQFTRDAIMTAEGPELVRAFWRTAIKMTVLDPTCGSGAFLFAALQILETVYSDCLERMERFIEDAAPGSGRPDHFNDFRETLEQVAAHPNRRYFILKSIIINNLFGVDLMEEAVEICKLRMFLKLVAQVDSADAIEPLPDIDFNIRAGNTLVGFASLDEVLASQKGKLGFGAGDVARINKEAAAVQEAFVAFRSRQTASDGKTNPKDKQQLKHSLARLGDRLDAYLAGDFGVEEDAPRQLEEWKASHEPFHWFVEFFGIMRDGGFDVIVGNPPYVELKALTEYELHGYTCLEAGNLYAVVIERCFALNRHSGRMGFIVPVSSVSTDRYEPLQKLLTSRQLHFSSFDDRPSRLFDGLEHIRLTIHLLGRPVTTPELYSTRYNKWSAEERGTLFDVLAYEQSRACLVEGTLPKLSSPLERNVIAKLVAQRARLGEFLSKTGGSSISYSRKVGYFLQVVDFVPEVKDGRGRLRPPSEFKELRFRSQAIADCALACLNANLFYWFITVFSDCRHVNKREVEMLPINLEALAAHGSGAQLRKLAGNLMSDLKKNSEYRRMRFAHDTLTVQCIIPKRSKRFIDAIDVALADYLGLTADEMDFVVNYDVKYRMGLGDED